MTPQEQQMIDGLIQRVNGTVVQDKDPEAEQHLEQGLGSNPNAIYILSQTVLVQQYALDQAKQQLDALKSQLAQTRQTQPQTPPQRHTGFLESIFGSSNASSTDHPAPPASPQGYAPVQNSVQTYSPSPAYAPPPANYAPVPSGGGGGFLRGAAQTAAGVAAGALAFQGVESLLHGFGGSMSGGSGLGGFGGNGAPREEVINNYYGDDAGNRDGGGDRNRFDAQDSSSNNPGDNLFTDADQGSSDDASSFDNSDSGDDSSFSDDSSGFSDDNGDLGNDNSF